MHRGCTKYDREEDRHELAREQFEVLEHARRELKLRRSTAVQQASARWLETVEGDARVDAYIRGYSARPDDARDARAVAKAWAEGVELEDW